VHTTMSLRREVVRSESGQDVHYVVTVVNDTPVACTCLSFEYRVKNDDAYACKHMLKVWQARTPQSIRSASV
jgi:hypothetical protein